MEEEVVGLKRERKEAVEEEEELFDSTELEELEEEEERLEREEEVLERAAKERRSDRCCWRKGKVRSRTKT